MDLRRRKVDQRELAAKGRSQINNAENARAKKAAKARSRAAQGVKRVHEYEAKGHKQYIAVSKAANDFNVHKRTVERWLKSPAGD